MVLLPLLPLDSVARPDVSGRDDTRADAAPVSEGARHAWLAQVLDVPAGRSWTIVPEDGLPDAERLPTQVLELYAAGDDVAPVLAVFRSEEHTSELQSLRHI